MDVIQLAVLALGLAGLYIVFTIGMIIVYSTLRILHIAHGGIIVIGGYVVYFTFLLLRNIGLAILAGIAVSVLAGIAIYKLVYEPLLIRRASPLMTLVASVGVYIAIEQALLGVFGSTHQSYPVAFNFLTYDLFGKKIFLIQIYALVLSVILVVLFWLFLKRTKLGLAVLACVQDVNLASIFGIDPRRVFLVAMIIGSAYTGLAGGFYTIYINDVYPTIGFIPMMVSFIAVIIGGMGSIFGSIFAALLIAFVETFCFAILPIPFPRFSVAFLLLVLMLIVRPYGLFGKKWR